MKSGQLLPQCLWCWSPPSPTGTHAPRPAPCVRACLLLTHHVLQPGASSRRDVPKAEGMRLPFICFHVVAWSDAGGLNALQFGGAIIYVQLCIISTDWAVPVARYGDKPREITTHAFWGITAVAFVFVVPQELYPPAMHAVWCCGLTRISCMGVFSDVLMETCPI